MRMNADLWFVVGLLVTYCVLYYAALVRIHMTTKEFKVTPRTPKNPQTAGGSSQGQPHP